MLKRFTRWKNLLKPKNRLLLSLFLISSWLCAEEIVVPIDYKVTAPKGYLYGTVDGETAYKDWRRGSFDKERMQEIAPQDLPDNLPEPVVIPFVAPKVNEVAVGKLKDPPLKGEDKIFVQIGKDELKARCFLLGQGCEELVKPEETDSVYFRPIEAQKKQRKIINP